ncbi:Sulfate transport system permease protein CysW [Leclercia adecarboxylata]|uniref:Sulfate transport system permease protein CysW n=1 Tax=Leclercia adecarboxylata TaxID=83655 RepID=A0A4U9HJT0_9ENTR|nr:Sulfate transport system permease protein CysW [Leclercia adecarboxylata]
MDYTLTLDNFIKLFGQGMSDGAWPSLLDTLLYAGIAAPITAAFGLLIAWIVVRQQFKGKKTIEFTTMLCFAVPGTVAGVSYILAFNSAPVYLTGTAAIVIISMVMRNVPVGIRAGIAGLGQIDKSLDEASLSLRAGSLRTITHILLPLLRPAILSALIYSFCACHYHRQRHCVPGHPGYPGSHGLHSEPRGRWRIRRGDCLRLDPDCGHAGDHFPL